MDIIAVAISINQVAVVINRPARINTVIKIVIRRDRRIIRVPKAVIGKNLLFL